MENENGANQMEKTFTGSELQVALNNLATDSRSYTGKEAVDAAMSAIPVIGGPLLSLTNDIATKRFVERAVEMFTIMKNQIEEMDKEKIDATYFESEECQTLVFLAMEQLRTTHDKKKIRMLATGLSNSGSTNFASEARKEDFLRILRDISPSHIRFLQNLVTDFRLPVVMPQVTNPDGDAAVAYASLAARGLVKDTLEGEESLPPLLPISPDISAHEIRDVWNDKMRVPARVYRINDFGKAFLRFLTEEAGKLASSTEQKS